MTLMTTFERWQNKVVAKCDSLGGRQKTTIINESGLYSLILSSKLPMAREFKCPEVKCWMHKKRGKIWLKTDIFPLIFL